MNGYNVFFPIGLRRLRPAGRERGHQAAASTPRDWTMRNIENMRRQLRSMGATFDWDARGRHLRARVLPLEPVALPAVPGGRPGLPRRWRRSTGAPRTRSCWRASRSRAPTASAGAAARRSSSATWSSGSSASPSTPTSCCDFDGHRLARADPRRCRPTGSAAREGAEVVFHGRPPTTSRAATSCASSPPGPDTLFGATFMVLAPEHPLVDEADRARAARGGRAPTSTQARAQDARSSGCRRTARRPACRSARTRSTRSTASASRSGSPTTCCSATAPARSWPCPAHDERDFAFAAALRPAHPARDRRAAGPARRRRR